MSIPLTNFQEPGFFSQVRETPSLFLLPGAIQVVALIGSGKKTKSFLQEQATRVDTGSNLKELLANPIASISRVYSDSVFQYPMSSYSTSMTGSVTEGLGFAASGKTLKISINDGAAQTITFTGVDPLALSAVVTQINAVLLSAKAVAVSAHLKIISSDVGDGGKKIKILDGTANAVLGFASDQICQNIDWTASIISMDEDIRPQDGENYYVDYEIPKVADDLSPKTFFSQQTLIAEYGDPSTTQTLGLGGQAAFGNGASVVVCRQISPDASSDGEIKTEVQAALGDLEVVDCDIVVPMVTDTSIWADYLRHVSKMSSKLERKERYAILGLNETSARLPLTGSGSYTTLMSSLQPNSGLEPHRLIVMNPGYAKTTIKGIQITVNGTYLAAGLAGLLVNPAYDEATPMTYKAMGTVDALLLPDISRSEKNILTSLGVTVVEIRGALVIVRRCVSADITSIAKQEPSIGRAADKLASQMRLALENRFIGQKITQSTIAAVESATNTFLLRFVGEELISAFRNVRAIQNSIEPRQVDISFEYLPIFPFIWGSLDLTITLS